MILVSGASGFMGRAITRQLLAGGHEVRAMSRSVERAQSVLSRYEVGRRALEEKRLTFVSADVTEPATLPEAVSGTEAVVQCAQFPGAPNEDPKKGLTYMKVDRDGTMNLLAAIAAVYTARTAGPGLTRFPDGAPRFLYLSGVTVSADATTTWDRAKWQAEEAIRGSGLDWTIVRASWTYGPEDTSLNRILGYSDLLPFVPLFGDGLAKITPLYVEDVGRLFRTLVEEPQAAADTTIPLGGPEVFTLNEVFRTALQVMGRRRPLLHIPKPIGKMQGAIMQFLPGRPLTPMAVDFVSQPGVADLTVLHERFPDFQTVRLRPSLESYLSPG
ncbi:MAG: NAD(P)H-binding protein [Thermoleophilia bacterium]|nr:NAD(P)H-binding protein [Thermoleophilia bacterium]